MHTTLIALLVTVSTFAQAQTPRDLANQVWPAGAPVSSNRAPQLPGSVHGGGTALDLARLAGRDGNAAFAATPAGTEFVASFTSADLARLRGDQTPSSTLFRAPATTRVVTR